MVRWIEGVCYFSETSLEDIMDKLARWYDAEIVCESSELQGMRFHIYMDRTKTLEEALQVISKMGDITYEIAGKKVIIKKR